MNYLKRLTTRINSISKKNYSLKKLRKIWTDTDCLDMIDVNELSKIQCYYYNDDDEKIEKDYSLYHMGHCICGKVIHKIFYITNKKKNKIIVMGSKCIKLFQPKFKDKIDGLLKMMNYKNSFKKLNQYLHITKKINNDTYDNLNRIIKGINKDDVKFYNYFKTLKKIKNYDYIKLDISKLYDEERYKNGKIQTSILKLTNRIFDNNKNKEIVKILKKERVHNKIIYETLKFVNSDLTKYFKLFTSFIFGLTISKKQRSLIYYLCKNNNIDMEYLEGVRKLFNITTSNIFNNYCFSYKRA